METLDVEEMEEEEEGGRRSSRRQAAKNVSYALDNEDIEYADSPASSSHSRDTGRPAKTRGRKRGGASGRGRGRKARSGPKVPPMKIKMIGKCSNYLLYIIIILIELLIFCVNYVETLAYKNED